MRTTYGIKIYGNNEQLLFSDEKSKSDDDGMKAIKDFIYIAKQLKMNLNEMELYTYNGSMNIDISDKGRYLYFHYEP